MRKIEKAAPVADAMAPEEPFGSGLGAGAGGMLETAGVPARCLLPPVGGGANVEIDPMVSPPQARWVNSVAADSTQS